MNNNSDDDKINYERIFAFLFIWIITTAISLFAGHVGGYVAGIRPGGWNIQMIYPPLLGGFIGLVSYPIMRFLLRIGSEDRDEGLFAGIPVSIVLAFGLTILIFKSGG